MFKKNFNGVKFLKNKGALFLIFFSFFFFGSLLNCTKVENKTPRYASEKCPFCTKEPGKCRYCQHALGKCQFCEGKGYRLEGNSQGHYKTDCKFCKKSGKCHYCGGSGTCLHCEGTGKIKDWDWINKRPIPKPPS